MSFLYYFMWNTKEYILIEVFVFCPLNENQWVQYCVENHFEKVNLRLFEAKKMEENKEIHQSVLMIRVRTVRIFALENKMQILRMIYIFFLQFKQHLMA